MAVQSPIEFRGQYQKPGKWDMLYGREFVNGWLGRGIIEEHEGLQDGEMDICVTFVDLGNKQFFCLDRNIGDIYDDNEACAAIYAGFIACLLPV